MELAKILLGSFASICIGSLIGFVIAVEISAYRQRKIAGRVIHTPEDASTSFPVAGMPGGLQAI